MINKQKSKIRIQLKAVTQGPIIHHDAKRELKAHIINKLKASSPEK